MFLTVELDLHTIRVNHDHHRHHAKHLHQRPLRSQVIVQKDTYTTYLLYMDHKMVDNAHNIIYSRAILIYNGTSLDTDMLLRG